MVNWWMTALGAAIAGGLLIGLAAIGGLRWWRRRRGLLQIAIILALPTLLIALTLLVALQLELHLEDVAGLLFGIGMTSALLLVATSYLIDQIRIAFSANDDPPGEE